MTIKNEAARLFFAISALILVTMLSSPQSERSSTTVATNAALKREIASFESRVSSLRSGEELKDSKSNKKARKTAEKKTSRKLVKKT